MAAGWNAVLMTFLGGGVVVYKSADPADYSNFRVNPRSLFIPICLTLFAAAYISEAKYLQKSKLHETITCGKENTSV